MFRFVSFLKIIFFTIKRKKKTQHLVSNVLTFSVHSGNKHSVDLVLRVSSRSYLEGSCLPPMEKGNFIHNETIREDGGSGIGSGTVRAFLPADFLEERLVCGHLEFMRGCLPPGKCYARVITYILEGRESRTGRPLAAFNHHYTLARFLRLLAP